MMPSPRRLGDTTQGPGRPCRSGSQ
jgi:hypothetical protein